MCKVTAIITTHNRADLLVNAINSVLPQTYKDFELLIVDDASIDNTEQIVKTFTDYRIRYIKITPEESKGANHARNIGVKESKGEFIAFLDDDDEWMPEKLESQLKAFEKNENIGLVYGGIEIINFHANKKDYFTPSKSGDLSKDILMSNCIHSTSGVMIKKAFLEEIGLFDTSLPAAQEYDLFIRLCQVCQIDFVEKPLLKYYYRNAIKSISGKIERYESGYALIDKKYTYLINNLNKSSRTQRELNKYTFFYLRATRNGEHTKLNKYYLTELDIKFNFRVFHEVL